MNDAEQPAKPDSQHVPTAEPSSARARSRRLVFISHDSRDAELAEAFENLLTDASGGILKSFRSSAKRGTTGIEFGSEWYQYIMSKLDDATDVVALLTANSLDRPWILYEAGVAKGKLNTQVIGVALGIPFNRVNRGPFAQFENSSDDGDSLTKLVLQLIRRNPEASPREEAVQRQVAAFKDAVSGLLGEDGDVEPLMDEGSAKLFEEIKVMVRDLPARVASATHHDGRRLRRLHPMFIEELLYSSPFPGTVGDWATRWMMLMGLVRDDLPWVYDVGMELYRAIRSGRRERIVVASEWVLGALQMTRHPMIEEMLMSGSKDTHMLVRRLPEILEDYLSRMGLGNPVKADAHPAVKDIAQSAQDTSDTD